MSFNRLVTKIFRRALSEHYIRPNCGLFLRQKSTQTQRDYNISLTDRAITKLQSLAEEKKIDIALRLKIDTGGCSGFQYEFSLEDGAGATKDFANSDDLTIAQSGVMLVIDKESLMFISDCQVDFKEEMIASAFEVVGNKSAASPCSCGRSFDLKNV